MKTMSDDVFGRLLEDEVEIDSCDKCGSPQVKWMHKETTEHGQTMVYFFCEECHESVKIRTPTVHRQVGDAVDFEAPVRPVWMDDFLEEGKEQGSINTIGDTDINSEVLKPSEAPESLEEVTEEVYSDEEMKSPELQQRVVASWSTAFIQEALFGKDPLNWLKNKNALSPDQIDQTIHTLEVLGTNQVDKVQMQVVKVLGYILDNNLFSDTEKVKNILRTYLDDNDQSIAAFVQKYV